MLATSSARRFSLLLAFSAVAAVAACGGGGGANTGGSGPGGGSASSSTASGTGGMTSSSSSSSGSGPECPAPGYGGNEASIQVTALQAKVVDLAGQPVGNLIVQLCGLDICLNGTTDGAGNVTINADKMLKAPAIKFGDALTYAKLGIPITEANPSFPTVVTAALPASGPVFEAGKAAVSGDVTVDIAAGTVVIVDELIYDTPDKQQFRAVTLPVDKMGAVLDKASVTGLVQLYGVAPIETHFCPAASVTVPNTSGLAADADVEFWIHGVEVGQDWAPYGGWAKVSDGKVSADGKTISTVAGGGLPVLAVFGIKPKMQ